MPFANFKYDVFLSYARADDLADEWIRRFEERLRNYLLQLQPEIAIFKDTRALDVNQRFDAVIRDALRQSAVLLPVISPAFQRSAYCRQEVHGFVEAARSGIGITVGTENHSRTFNVLRFKIGFEQWFQELAGVNALTFFKPERDYGTPIDPDSEEGKSLIRALAEQIAKTLDVMRAIPPATGRARRSSATDPPTVYLPETYGSLIWDQEELCTALRRADVPIRLRQDPASKPSLIEGFNSSDLAIILADKRPGPDTLKQLELADVYAERWVVAVHPSADLSAPGPDEYYERLIALRDGSGQRNHTFLHHPNQGADATIGVDEVAEEAIATLRQIARSSDTKDLMLDTNRADRKLGREIETHLTSRGIETRWLASDTQSQAEAYLKYEDLFNRCRAAILVYGAIEKKWVEDRLDEVRKACRDSKGNINNKVVGVFYGPPLENKAKLSSTLKVGGSVLIALEDIDYSRNWKAEIDKFLERAGF